MKHWVFDLDGTLVDSFAHYFETLDLIFRENGARFVPEMRKAALTESLEVFFARHLGANSVPRIFDRLQVLSNDSALKIRPFSGIEEFLKSLVERNARLAVWTNRDLTSASLILKHSGLASYFETCVSGTCVSQRKPNPEGLARIIREFDCAPDEVTMVGDHEHDVSAAKTLGTRGVRANWHSYWDEGECDWSNAQFTSVSEFHSWALEPR